MANEGSSKGFAKVFHKKVHRTKEKVLHSLGKADRTADTQFDEHVHNFQQQQTVASKLQKELKNYINCVKAMQNASNNFYTTVREIWEVDWVGYAEMRSALEQLSFVWEDHLDRLTMEVQNPLSIYLGHFPELRSKISKRGRKLVDYDSSRHNLQSLENAKKRDEGKILKAQEDLQEAENIYNTINVELHNELPSFYSSRINSLSSTLSSFFTVEGKFQEESAKIKNAMANTSDDLQREYHNGILSTPQIAKSLRNGNLEDDDTVDLSRNELSPMATPGRYEQDSPSNSRGGSHSNSYRRGSSASQSSASDRGGQTPVSQPRGSVQSVGKDTRDANSSKENSLNREVQKKPSGSEENAYEDFNYDDGSYEAVSVGAQIEGASVGESSDTGPQEKKKPSPKEENSRGTENPAPKPRLRLDEEEAAEDSEEDEEQVYKIPTSNEPVNSKIPEGMNVLYKSSDNPCWDATTATDQSGVKATPFRSDLKASVTLEKPSNSNDSSLDYITLIPGKSEAVYELEKLGIGNEKAAESTFFGTMADNGTNQVVEKNQIEDSYSMETFTASNNKADNNSAVVAAILASGNDEVPPAVPRRSPSTFGTAAVSSQVRSSQIENMLAKSRENIETPSIIAAEQEVEAIFSQNEPLALGRERSGMPKTSKPPRTHIKLTGESTRNTDTIGEKAGLFSNEVKSSEERAALESFAQLESVFDRIDPFGSSQTGDGMEAFPNGGQTPVQKDPFAGADPFANETPSPVVGVGFGVQGNQSKSESALFIDSFETSPFGGMNDNISKHHDPFMPQNAVLESFDPLGDNQFENSFTDSLTASGIIQTERSNDEGFKMGEDSSPSGDLNKDASSHQKHPKIEITSSQEDSLTLDQLATKNLTMDKSDLSEGDLDPRFAGHDGIEDSVDDKPFTSGQILYRVQATHNYTGEDTDELTFEMGEIVCVVPFEDPDDQDDGWLYGVKESDGEKGMFPANFTRRL